MWYLSPLFTSALSRLAAVSQWGLALIIVAQRPRDPGCFSEVLSLPPIISAILSDLFALDLDPPTLPLPTPCATATLYFVCVYAVECVGYCNSGG